MLKKNSKLIQSVDDLKSSRMILLGINCVLAVAVCLMGLLLTSVRTEVVVTPPEFYEEMRISGNQANEHYKVRWAFASAAIAGNLNPRNVDFVVAQLEQMFSPYLRENVLPEIRREAHILRARDATQRFVIEDVIYDPTRDLIWVYGDRTLQMRGSRRNEQPHSQRWTYEFRIAPFSGRPAINHFDSYSGLPRNRNVEYAVERQPMLDSSLSEVTTE